MKSLTDVYNQVASKDAELEKQATQMIKQAEEEDAAGRITARGFADELAKIAGGYNTENTFAVPHPQGPKPQGSVPSGGYQTGGGKTGANYDPFKAKAGGGAATGAGAGGGPRMPAAGGPSAATPKPPQMAQAGGAPKPKM